MEPYTSRAFLYIEPKRQTNCILGCKAYATVLTTCGLAFTYLPSFQIESRYIQQIPLKYSPVQMTYAPDGKSLLYVSGGNQLFFLTYNEIDGGDAKKDGKPVKEWRTSDGDIVRPGWSVRSFCDNSIIVFF